MTASKKSKIQFVEKVSEKKIDVLINEQLFTSYIYPKGIAKPVLFPLNTKSGKSLTRGYPLVPKEGERSDHPHHIGYWLNYGDVNGFDFWNNSFKQNAKGKYGTIFHQETLKLDDKNGMMRVKSKWVSDEKEDLLDEQTEFVFFEKGDTRYIDRYTTLTALKDISFTDNKEGMVAIRVIRALELPSNKATYFIDKGGKRATEKTVNNKGVQGDYLSSEGITGSNVWGTRAKWMHLHSRLNDEYISLTLIDHPDNMGYPTYWHARGYGLFAANPLGQKALSKGKEVLNFKLKKGDSVTFKYRLLVHAGEALKQEKIMEAFKEFADKS